MELYQNHPLASIGVPYHDVTQQAVLFPEVEVGHACSLGVAVNLVAYVVVQVVHEPAFCYRINLVEGTRYVEADGVQTVVCLPENGVFRGIRFRHVLQLLGCEPTFVGASVLYLVPVFLCLYGPHDGAALRQLYLSYP